MIYTKFPSNTQFKKAFESLSIIERGLLITLHLKAYLTPTVCNGVHLEPAEVIVNSMEISKKLGISRQVFRTSAKKLEALDLIEKKRVSKKLANQQESNLTSKITSNQPMIYLIKTIFYVPSWPNSQPTKKPPLLSKYGKETQYFLERFKSMYDQRMLSLNLPDRYDLTPEINKKVAFDIINDIKLHIPGEFRISWVDVLIKVYFQLQDKYLLDKKFPMRLMAKRLLNLIEIAQNNQEYMFYIDERSTTGRTASNETKDEKSVDFETFGLN